jgi:hypothetical protein
MTQLQIPMSSSRRFRPARFNRIVSDGMSLGLHEYSYRRPLARPRFPPIPGMSNVIIDTGTTTVAAPFLKRCDARSLAVSCGELKWEYERGKVAATAGR